MQIQQLRYLIAAAEEGSFRAAASKLFVAQSSVSVAVRDVEQETGVEVFRRTPRGTTLTPEGAELVDYARSVIEQLELMERRYARDNRGPRTRFAVSAQHYSLVVDAFGDFAAAHDDERCEFTLRESYTNEVIRDVSERRSDLGVIYLSSYNDRVVGRALAAAGLGFTSLYTARPHVIVRAGHPLAGRASVRVDELAGFYRLEQEQGLESSSYFAEEPLASVPHERKLLVSDNGTLSTLLERTDGYALGTGAFPNGDGRFAIVEIETDEVMNVGCIRASDAARSELADEFLALLAARILAFDGPIVPAPHLAGSRGPLR